MNYFYDLPQDLQDKIYYELHKLNFNKSLNFINNFISLWQQIEEEEIGWSNWDTNPIEINKTNYFERDNDWLIMKEKWVDIDKSNEKNTICYPKVFLRIMETKGYNNICDLTKCIKCNDFINSYIINTCNVGILTENSYICETCKTDIFISNLQGIYL